MARKDVSLVINAQDKASSALDRISASLEDFRAGQQELDGQAQKTSSSLGQITKALDAVEKAFGGLDGASKLRAQLDEAAQAVDRLRVETETGNTSIKEYEKKLKDAGKAVAQYDAKIARSIAAQAKQSKALKEAAAAARVSSKAQVDASAAQDKLQSRLAELPALIGRQEAALVKVSARYSELSARMTSVAAISPSLQAQFDSNSRNVAKNEAALASLKAEYTGLGAAVKKSTKELTSASGGVARANANVTKAKAKVEALAQAHEKLTDSARKARVEQKGLEKALADAAAGGARAKGGYDKAAAALDQLRSKSAATEVALKELAAISVNKLGDQIVKQGLAFNSAKQDVSDLSARVRAYRTEIAAAGVPTREMAQNLAKLEQAADEAGLKMLRQEETLRKLGAEYRKNGTSLEGVSKSMRSFGAEQDRLAADLRELTNDGYKARRAIDELNKAQQRSSSAKAAADIRRLGDEARRAKPKISELRQEYNRLYGGSRQSLSVNQRLRGEVLSMIAAYGGLYGVINLLRQTVDAMQVLEAATARLNVANNGNFAQTGADLDYLRFQANRLGINLGTLSTEFSRFSIATQGTNLAGQRTRDIFVSVAEAARVARISNEQLSGIFTALTQIVSKGAVQMEELRQQLGDRLPGALQIMADGLGLTTGELIKMMEQGQITADALLPFADELTRRFGPGLAQALTSTAAELGRLQNAAFGALIVFGEAGFIEAFVDLIRDLIELLESASFQTFTERVSQLFATLAEAAGFLVRNFETVGIVIGAAIGLKSVTIVTRLATAFYGLVASMLLIPARARAAAAGLTATAGAAGAATGGFIALRAAVIGFLSATGVGVLLVVAGALIGKWLTGASAMNTAMESHERIMGDVQQAYEEANGSVAEFMAAVTSGSVTEARNNLQLLEEAVQDSAKNIGDALRADQGTAATNLFGLNLARLFGEASREYQDAVDELLQSVTRGEVDARDLRAELDKLAETFRDGSDANMDLANALDDGAKEFDEAYTAMDQARDILTLYTGTAEEAEAAMERLANRGAEAASDIAAFATSSDDAAEAIEKLEEATDKLTGSLRDILKELPEMEEYFARLEESDAMVKLRNDALAAALEIVDVNKAWDELTTAIGGFQWSGIFDVLMGDLGKITTLMEGIGGAFDGLTGRFGNLGTTLNDAVGGLGNFLGEFTANLAAGAPLTGSAIERSAQLVRDKEGFRNVPYNDPATDANGNQVGPDIWRAGYGSNTFMRNGSVQTVQQSSRVTRDEAEADLARRLVEFQNVIIGQIGADTFRGMEESQQAVLTSIAYNYGNLPGRVAGPINAGASDAAIAEAIIGLSNDNGGINARRRAQEAAIFVTTTDPDGTAQREIEGAQPTLDQNQALAEGRQQLEVQQLINEGREREAEILQARNAALAANPNILPDQLAAVEALAGETFDLAAAGDLANDAATEASRLAEETAAQREATGSTLDDAEFAIRQQDLMNQGLERQALIEAAIRQAKASDPNITAQEIALLTTRTSALYDAERAGAGVTDELEAAEKAQERINELTEKRTALQELLEASIENGDTEKAMELQEQISAVNLELLTAIDNAEKLWEAVGGTAAETAIAQLGTARLETQNFGQDADNAYLKWDTLSGLFIEGLAKGFDQFAQAVANGENRLDAARDAFLQFVGDFLVQIAQMILKQAIFNALQMAFGGTSFGSFVGITAATGHTGGRVGSKRVGGGNRVKTVNPGVFASAARYHGGGMIGGLSPGEVPIIAKEGEYMASENDPLHPNNQSSKPSGGGGGGGEMTIYNLVDGEAVMRAALAADKGGNLLLNHIRANKDSFKAILNG